LFETVETGQGVLRETRETRQAVLGFKKKSIKYIK
jgi:hypothetical protein